MTHGIQPTVGQAKGGLLDKAESAIGKSSIVFGDAVRAARNRGFEELGSNFREHAPQEYTWLSKLLGLGSFTHPHVSIPALIAAHIGGERPAQKALLGGYPMQKGLGQIAKAAALAKMNEEGKPKKPTRSEYKNSIGIKTSLINPRAFLHKAGQH